MQGGGPRYPYSTREWVGPAGLTVRLAAVLAERDTPVRFPVTKASTAPPSARAACPRHLLAVPLRLHHHHPPSGAHCRTQHSRGGVRYLSAPFANKKSVVHSLILGVLASPSAQHYHHHQHPHQHHTNTLTPPQPAPTISPSTAHACCCPPSAPSHCNPHDRPACTLHYSPVLTSAAVPRQRVLRLTAAAPSTRSRRATLTPQCLRHG